jgi:hypothetical protein
MKRLARLALVGLALAALAAGVVVTIRQDTPSRAFRAAGRAAPTKLDAPRYDLGFTDDSGYTLSIEFTGPISDRGSLDEVRRAIAGRGRRGLEACRAAVARLDGAAGPEAETRRALAQLNVALMHLYEGQFAEADTWLARALTVNPSLPPGLKADLIALRGVAALRRGESENCVACIGPSSCILPIAPEAVHARPDGSRAAIRFFDAYLRRRPEDLGVRWLLNIGYMTLGEYPAKVPPHYLIPIDQATPSSGPGRFVNVASESGLGTRGANLFGGCACDDFDGDGLADLFVASHDWDKGASLFLNRGDGTFEDRGGSLGLGSQNLAQNLAHADFDNDGRLDVVLTRGAWEAPCRLSLLRNTGDGFVDVTRAAGLAEPIASQTAAWGDFDNDGWLDLFVGGEDHPPNHDRRNRSRLYHNNGDGTFNDVAGRAGVTNGRWAKGATWGDYDGDGDPDLYVSNLEGPNRLYRNEGDGTFTDVAPMLGVTEPLMSFSCWFWDFDNDGRLDLFVTGFFARLGDLAASMLGRPDGAARPRLYRNLGPDGFRDVTAEAGLDRLILPMGSNFGDIDNDGYLDFYLATGRPPYAFLVPNRMFRNVDGRRFEDVTTATGTGHLQKGHGVGFADFDRDGDLDLFVQVGGSVPGDRGHNLLFRNPGSGGHWLDVKLVGTRTNRAAIGARVRAEVRGPDGSTRSIERTVTAGSSFGGNSLVVHLGLGAAGSVASLIVDWPTSRTRQTFRDLEADRTIEIREGSNAFRNLGRGQAPAAP